MSTAPRPSGTGLPRGRLGTAHLVFLTVAASAPLTVLAGGVTTMYAVSGNIGAAGGFVLLAGVLALFAVGYAAMSRYVTDAGAFYTYVTAGLGRTAGVAASGIALTAYNAIQIGLYGLLGASLADVVADRTGSTPTWWATALTAWALVATLGVLRIDLNATVLAVLLLAECAVVLVFDATALANPAHGTLTLDGLRPDNLFGAGLGAVLAFGIACFTGFESAAVYGEEARDPGRTVARATGVALTVTGLLYALSAWSLTVTTGPADTPAAAAGAGPGLVFGVLAAHLGPGPADLATVLFVTSVLAALLSFHNSVARYLYALGRDGVLPRPLATASRRTGAPVAGSVTQSLLALVVVGAFALAGRDPVVELFTWLSGVAAVGVVLLMTLTSAAVVRFFGTHGRPRSRWRHLVAPGLATLLLAVVLVVLVVNMDALLAPGTPAGLRWLLPAVPVAAAVAGPTLALRGRRDGPDAYRNVGGRDDGEAVRALP